MHSLNTLIGRSPFVLVPRLKMNSARQLRPRNSVFSGALIIVGTGTYFPTPLPEKHKVRTNDQKPAPVLRFSGPASSERLRKSSTAKAPTEITCSVRLIWAQDPCFGRRICSGLAIATTAFRFDKRDARCLASHADSETPDTALFALRDLDLSRKSTQVHNVAARRRLLKGQAKSAISGIPDVGRNVTPLTP
jgi:hypothetical protein